MHERCRTTDENTFHAVCVGARESGLGSPTALQFRWRELIGLLQRHSCYVSRSRLLLVEVTQRLQNSPLEPLCRPRTTNWPGWLLLQASELRFSHEDLGENHLIISQNPKS